MLCDHSRLRTLLWKNLVLSTLPNCPECVARERKALKIQYETEAKQAEEEGKDYLIPADRDIGTCLLYTSDAADE